MSDEEYEGITLTVDPSGWPPNLAGIRIGDHTFFIKDGVVKIVGDPIWDLSTQTSMLCPTCDTPRMPWEDCPSCGEIDA
mgnify:CR=1 FL=1